MISLQNITKKYTVNGEEIIALDDINFEILHENFIGDDKIIFLKRK